MDGYVQKLQYVSVVLLMIAGLFLLSILLISGKELVNGNYSQRSSRSNGVFSGQNIVFASISKLAVGISDTTETIVDSTANTVGSGFNTVGNALGFIGNRVSGAVLFVSRAPGTIFRTLTSPPSASALIRPGTESQNQVPVIKPIDTPTKTISKAPAFIEQTSVLTSTQQTNLWPIRGRITTFFGVPHWPYQPTHTGMDIASGSASGITPIHSFRAGRVTETIYSSRGLGNHVIVDHGNGLTSLYAHLYTISVQPGREVNTDTVLGLEGSTGVSTGAHLHFEIRQDGVHVDPSQYITGRP